MNRIFPNLLGECAHARGLETKNDLPLTCSASFENIKGFNSLLAFILSFRFVCCQRGT